jgi:hypothetical protein
MGHFETTASSILRTVRVAVYRLAACKLRILQCRI